MEDVLSRQYPILKSYFLAKAAIMASAGHMSLVDETYHRRSHVLVRVSNFCGRRCVPVEGDVSLWKRALLCGRGMSMKRRHVSHLRDLTLCEGVCPCGRVCILLEGALLSGIGMSFWEEVCPVGKSFWVGEVCMSLWESVCS